MIIHNSRKLIICTLFLVLFGCSSYKIHSDSIVILSKGIGPSSSAKFDEIANSLNFNGQEAISCKYYNSSAISRAIIRNKPKSIILIGHSAGADNAIHIARQLDKREIEVEWLILLDPAFPPQVPNNVVNCLDMYVDYFFVDKSDGVMLVENNSVTKLRIVKVEGTSHCYLDDHFYFDSVNDFGIIQDIQNPVDRENLSSMLSN